MKWKDRKNVYKTIIIRGIYKEERKKGRNKGRKKGLWNERIERMCIEL